MISIFIINSLQFKIVDSSPIDNTYPVGTTDAMFAFNKDLDPKTTKDSFIVTIDPKQDFNIKIDKKTLHILFTYPPKQAFKLSIRNIKSSGGDTIPSLSHNYIVMDVPESQLTKYELSRRMSFVDAGVNTPSLSVDMSPLYKIEQRQSRKYPNDPNKSAVYISSDKPTDKFAAIKYIYDLGYDPSDFEIVFKEPVD